MDQDLFKKALSRSKEGTSPSLNFTQSVIQKVEAQKSQPITIEPLIPKKTLMRIGIIYTLLCLLPIFMGAQESALYFVNKLPRLGYDGLGLKQSLQVILIIGFTYASFTLIDLWFSVKQNIGSAYKA